MTSTVITLPPRHFAILILICLAFFLPGQSTLPVMDRDEARFVQASKQMIESGDYVDIRFQDTPRHKKPVGIYWLQSASVKLFGTGADSEIWVYRLPSLLGAVLAVLLTYLIGAHLFDPRSALIGASVLAGSFSLTVEAHLAKTDAMLLATVAAAQFALALLYHRDQRAPPGWAGWLFWAALGIGILIKGPLTPMIAGLTVLALAAADKNRAWLRDLKPLRGVILCAAIVAPWVIALTLREGGGGGTFWRESVGGDLLPKLIGGQESHGAPPGYHTALLALTLWPGSLFLIPALIGAWRARGRPAVRFLIAWILPAWIVFEAVPTKLPHYTLPVFPALALLIGAMIAANTRPDVSRLASAINTHRARLALALWVCVSVAIGAGLFWAATTHSSQPAVEIVALATLAAAAAGLVAGFLYLRRRFWQACVAALIGAALSLGTTVQLLAPTLDGLFVSPRLAAAIGRADPNGTATRALSGYREPSAVFLIGTKTQLLPPEAAADLLRDAPAAVVAIEGRARDAFLTRARAHGVIPHALDTVSGLNYSKGKPVEITLYVRGEGT